MGRFRLPGASRRRAVLSVLACGVVAGACGLVAGACAAPFSALGDDDDAGGGGRIGSEVIGSDSADGSGQATGSGSGGEVGAGGGGTASGTAGDEVDIIAEFVDGPCPFEPPTGYEPRCGIVEVPMDWERGEGSLQLAVALFPSTGANPADDPVIYLDGGPGSHALETIEFAIEDFLEPLLARGDVIFFDQRGAGLSRPSLDCTETEAVSRRVEDEPTLSDAEATEAFHGALTRCRTRLVGSGVDLADFNSINNAHDVEAIRVSLGYEQWNLFGISYGTKLGLEVLRRHPEGVRSAVLDSVYPPQVDSVSENPETFLASYELVVAACAAEPSCAAGGDLADRISAVVARYQAEPVEIEIRDWIADETDRVFVTGESIAELILGALYSPYQFTDIPELVAELEGGRTEAVTSFISQDRTTERFFTDGMFYAIACNEEISFADPDQVAAALPADPFGLKDRFDFASNTGTLAFGTCRAFDNGRAPDVSNTPVTSDIPALIMAGVYDPVTPVAWGEQAAATMTNSQLVVGPYSSHGVSGDRCGISIVIGFLDAPDSTVDAGCLDDEPLRFVAPSSTDVELQDVTFEIPDFGVEISTVQPTEWSTGSLNGDQYRRDSFLDPTELYQLAGSEALGPVLADFIETEQKLTIGGAEPFTGRVGPIVADELPGTWRRRSGRSDSVAVEWFETEQDGRATYVILVATVEQVDGQLASVLLPALRAIEVTAR